MTTREEFEDMVENATRTAIEWLDKVEENQFIAESAPEAHAAKAARLSVISAWDAQAAEVERLRAEVEALRVGVPLTAENAPRARVVERSTSARSLFFDESVVPLHTLWRFQHDMWRTRDEDVCLTTEQLVELGATVLAWRK